jgi:hypothetical protein
MPCSLDTYMRWSLGHEDEPGQTRLALPTLSSTPQTNRLIHLIASTTLHTARCEDVCWRERNTPFDMAMCIHGAMHSYYSAALLGSDGGEA